MPICEKGESEELVKKSKLILKSYKREVMKSSLIYSSR
jgi:hypothetical protein